MDPPSPPKDTSLRNIIDKIAEFVARNGPEFEEITKQKQSDNPKFEFLFGGKYYSYYQYRVLAEESILNTQPATTARNQTSQHQIPPNSQMAYPPPGILIDQQQQPVGRSNVNSTNGNSSTNFTGQIEAINMQQITLREQIHQSEKNLSAQHSALRQQQEKQIEETIEKAQNETLELLADDNDIRLAEFDAILQPIVESCTKDSISAGKNWILQHTTDTAKCNVVLQYLLKKALLTGSTFSQKLHLIYLVNDVLHHCVRKNATDLKSQLENVVIPMFCSADIIASNEQRAKLTKLLSLWESKAKFFDACVISKLQSPESSMEEYRRNLKNKFNDWVGMCIQKTKDTLESYQKQHTMFIQHATSQITALETQKQILEQQIIASIIPNTSILPPQNQGQFGQQQQQQKNVTSSFDQSNSFDNTIDSYNHNMFEPNQTKHQFGQQTPKQTNNNSFDQPKSSFDHILESFNQNIYDTKPQQFDQPTKNSFDHILESFNQNMYDSNQPKQQQFGQQIQSSLPQQQSNNSIDQPKNSFDQLLDSFNQNIYDTNQSKQQQQFGQQQQPMSNQQNISSSQSSTFGSNNSFDHILNSYNQNIYDSPTSKLNNIFPMSNNSQQINTITSTSNSSQNQPPPPLMAQEYQKPLSETSFGAFIEANAKQTSASIQNQQQSDYYYGNYNSSDSNPFQSSPTQSQSQLQQQQPPQLSNPTIQPPPTISYPQHMMQKPIPSSFSIPDLSKPPPNLSSTFDASKTNISATGGLLDEVSNQEESEQKLPEEDIMPTVPYYELPAGLMVPLIRLEDYQYKPLDPADIRLPPPTLQNERLTSAFFAYYSLPSHDRVRDVEGWEKLGLYEYYKVKNAAKKQKEEELINGSREKSRSPTPIFLEQPKPKRSNKRRYRSKSRSRSRTRSKSPPRRSRSRTPPPIIEKSRNRNRKSPKKNREREREKERERERKERDKERDRSESPPCFSGANYEKPNPEFIEETNKGHQMLKKMGWGGSGTGLGSKNQGIDAPISGGEVRDRSDMYKGLGVNMVDPFENFRKNKGAAFIHRMRTRAEEKS